MHFVCRLSISRSRGNQTLGANAISCLLEEVWSHICPCNIHQQAELLSTLISLLQQNAWVLPRIPLLATSHQTWAFSRQSLALTGDFEYLMLRSLFPVNLMNTNFTELLSFWLQHKQNCKKINKKLTNHAWFTIIDFYNRLGGCGVIAGGVAWGGVGVGETNPFPLTEKNGVNPVWPM